VADLQGQLDAAQRENRHCRAARHIKKNVGHSLRTVPERYERIRRDEKRSLHPDLCAPSGSLRPAAITTGKNGACPGPRAVENQTLAQEIDQIHTRSRQTYGSPRIVKDALRKQGRRHGRNRVARS
jgi:hypothetical protein